MMAFGALGGDFAVEEWGLGGRENRERRPAKVGRRRLVKQIAGKRCTNAGGRQLCEQIAGERCTNAGGRQSCERIADTASNALVIISNTAEMLGEGFHLDPLNKYYIECIIMQSQQTARQDLIL